MPSQPVMLNPPARRWYCPNCLAEVETVGRRAGIPLHPCPQLAGLSAPLVPAGVPADVRAVERQDYIGGDMVHTDGDGRPVMAVVTERDDGQDAAVMAPTAVGDRDG